MKRAGRFAALVALAAAASILPARDASAYCRTSVCTVAGSSPPMQYTGATCDPPYPDDCGIPLFWSSPCVEFSIQQDGSPKRGITADQMGPIMLTAFETWNNAACLGGGNPRMKVTQGSAAECDHPEYNQSAGNANVIMFHDASWPYEGTPNTLALTTVTYDLDTGEIYDADMEINSADVAFTIGNTNVDYDLPSIVTHESGHFQGLAHSHDAAATMWPAYNEHTTNLRNLTADDSAAICAAYPPGPAPSSCDPTPRHGFSALCSSDQAVAINGCAASRAQVTDEGFGRGGWLAAAALFAVLRFRWGTRQGFPKPLRSRWGTRQGFPKPLRSRRGARQGFPDPVRRRVAT